MSEPKLENKALAPGLLDDLSSLAPPSFASSFRSFPETGLPGLDSATASEFLTLSDETYRSFEVPPSTGHGWHSLGQASHSLDDTLDRSVCADTYDSGAHNVGSWDDQVSSLNPKHSSRLTSATDDLFMAKFKSAPIGSDISVEPPPVPGGYLEPSYHVLSSSEARQLVQAVLGSLQAAQVDCVARHDKYKLKCTAYRNGSKLAFAVRVFSLDSGTHRYALEFQRRSGDSLYFSEVYRSVKQALQQQKLIDSPIVSAAIAALSQPLALTLPPDLSMDTGDNAVAADQAQSTITSLLQMVSSDYVDVKAQAMLALADLTAQGSVIQESLSEERVLTPLIREIACKHEDVHRCAITALANLARDHETVCTTLAQSPGVLATLYDLVQDSRTPQVVREAARLLSNLGMQLGARVVDEQFVNAFKRLQCSADPRARDSVANLLERVNLRGY